MRMASITSLRRVLANIDTSWIQTHLHMLPKGNLTIKIPSRAVAQYVTLIPRKLASSYHGRQYSKQSLFTFRHRILSSGYDLVTTRRVSSCENSSTESDQENDKKINRRRRSGVELKGDEHLTADQWRLMKKNWNDERKQQKRVYIPRSEFEFELHAMDEVAAHCLLRTCESFIEYLLEDANLNYQIVSRCLFMSVSCKDQSGILWCVDWLDSYSGVMDKGMIANAISGLCLTDRWRDSLGFVSKADKMESVTGRILEPVFLAACEHGDLNLAKDIIDDHYRRDLVPSEACCQKLLSTFHCDGMSSREKRENEEMVGRLLKTMREKRHFPAQSVAEEMATWFSRKSHENWSATHTSISHEGICQSCKSHLDSLTVTEAEFQQLKDEIFTKVIRGQDIFRKSTPEELEAFMTFVDDGPRYDVVLDGLNVANIKKQRQPGKVLREFVVHLVKKRGFKCLVLGRHHMLKQDNRYERRDMAAIQDLADCFFTENMSEDDPFMLYATMHSGPNTRYVSRDMLRDHKALLSPESHHAFIKWQRTRQLIPLEIVRGKPIFQENLQYDTVIQSTERSWHIPYDNGQPRFSYEVPLTWLCVVKH